MKILQNIPLKDFSNYKIGGNASYFASVTSKEELIEVLREWNMHGEIFTLGGGANILISDEGFDGLVIRNEIKGLEIKDDQVVCGAGENMPDLLSFCIENNLSGLEWAGGLPGTVGGAVRGNAGAFFGEMKDSVSKVKSINVKTLEEKERNNKELKFGYRNSIFKTEASDEIIFEVILDLEKGNHDEIRAATQEKIDHRKNKHPLEYPNIGSTFKNVELNKIPIQHRAELSQYVKNDPFPVVAVAKLLSLANLKGKRVGDAKVSEKHPNFIVNLGHAKASDVKELIAQIKEEIKNKYGITLEEEIMYL